MFDKIENGKTEKTQDLEKQLPRNPEKETTIENKDAIEELKVHLKKELLLSKTAFNSGDEKEALNHFMNALMYRKSLGRNVI